MAYNYSHEIYFLSFEVLVLENRKPLINKQIPKRTKILAEFERSILASLVLPQKLVPGQDAVLEAASSDDFVGLRAVTQELQDEQNRVIPKSKWIFPCQNPNLPRDLNDDLVLLNLAGWMSSAEFKQWEKELLAIKSEISRLENQEASSAEEQIKIKSRIRALISEENDIEEKWKQIFILKHLFQRTNLPENIGSMNIDLTGAPFAYTKEEAELLQNWDQRLYYTLSLFTNYFQSGKGFENKKEILESSIDFANIEEKTKKNFVAGTALTVRFKTAVNIYNENTVFYVDIVQSKIDIVAGVGSSIPKGIQHTNNKIVIAHIPGTLHIRYKFIPTQGLKLDFVKPSNSIVQDFYLENGADPKAYKKSFADIVQTAETEEARNFANVMALQSNAVQLAWRDLFALLITEAKKQKLTDEEQANLIAPIQEIVSLFLQDPFNPVVSLHLQTTLKNVNPDADCYAFISATQSQYGSQRSYQNKKANSLSQIFKNLNEAASVNADLKIYANEFLLQVFTEAAARKIDTSAWPALYAPNNLATQLRIAFIRSFGEVDQNLLDAFLGRPSDNATATDLATYYGFGWLLTPIKNTLKLVTEFAFYALEVSADYFFTHALKSFQATTITSPLDVAKQIGNILIIGLTGPAFFIAKTAKIALRMVFSPKESADAAYHTGEDIYPGLGNFFKAGSILASIGVITSLLVLCPLLLLQIPTIGAPIVAGLGKIAASVGLSGLTAGPFALKAASIGSCLIGLGVALLGGIKAGINKLTKKTPLAKVDLLVAAAEDVVPADAQDPNGFRPAPRKPGPTWPRATDTLKNATQILQRSQLKDADPAILNSPASIRYTKPRNRVDITNLFAPKVGPDAAVEDQNILTIEPPREDDKNLSDFSSTANGSKPK